MKGEASCHLVHVCFPQLPPRTSAVKAFEDTDLHQQGSGRPGLSLEALLVGVSLD